MNELTELLRCKCPHDLGDCDQQGDCPCFTCHLSYEDRTALMAAMPSRREPDSPVGPEPVSYKPGSPFMCDCGHGWNHHDDYGCLWTMCMCNDMGERK